MSTRQAAVGSPPGDNPSRGILGYVSKSIPSGLLVSVLTCFLASAHFFLYCPLVSLALYRLAGGITPAGGWTRFGGAPFAWTIPLQLPGTLLQSIEGPGTATAVVGLMLLIAASLGTAYCVSSVLGGWIRGEGFRCGRFGWKGLMIVLGMIWIPVPEQWALIYYFTVKY